MNPCLCGAGIVVEQTYDGTIHDPETDERVGETIAAFVRCVQCGWSWLTTTSPLRFEKEDAA